MPDMEKTKKGLERCLVCDTSVIASEEAQNAYCDCEYTVGLYCNQKKLLYDALALLKEQEAVPVYEDKNNKCECGETVCRYWHPKFCGFCGKELQWY